MNPARKSRKGGIISASFTALFVGLLCFSQLAWCESEPTAAESDSELPPTLSRERESEPSAESDNNQKENDEPEGETLELERLAVTGSRIRRVDTEGALPVTVITREMIELSGDTSLSDVLRGISMNSFGSYRSHFQGDMGNTLIDLRGLGAARSLVLIDGKRMGKSPTSSAYQNLNSIPLGAVERIEILSDGASAIYGSDAIGGVINIITRERYTGWELAYGRAEPKWGKGSRDHGTLMFSAGTEKTEWLVNLSWNRKDISFIRDYPGVEPGESPLSNNFDVTNPDTGFPEFYFTAIPGGCNDSDAFYLVPDEYSLTGQLCLYDFNRVFADETSEDSEGLMVKFRREISPRWQLTAYLNGTNADSYGRFAPQSFTSLFVGVPISESSPNNPTNPVSPMHDPAFGRNVPVHWLHRFESLGFRDRWRDSKLISADLGLDGWVGETEIEFGVRGSRNDTDEEFWNLLNVGVILQFIEDGTYNLQSPLQNPAEVRDAMARDVESQWSFDQDEAYATVRWDWLQTRAGPMQWVLGGEYREESFNGVPPLSDIPSHSDRDTTTLYFETLVPVSQNLELTVAGRYDDYSDWGSEFSPKISLRWRASEKLTARASWGEGYRAPELSINATQPESFAEFRDDDEPSCDAAGRDELPCPIAYQSHLTVSDALSAETSEQYSLGLVWDPVDWFSQTVDYYDITIHDEIGFFSDDDILQFDRLGLAPPGGLGVLRCTGSMEPGCFAENQLLSITSGWGNWGLVETSGVDLNTHLKFDAGPGRLRSNLQWSRVFEHSSESVGEPSYDVVGLPGFPEERAALSNYYDIGNYTFSWIISYIGSQDEILIAEDTGENVGEHVSSWVSHDLQANWRTPWDGRLTVGVQNLTDETPPNADGPGNFDIWLYDFYGRIYYLNYTQTFD